MLEVRVLSSQPFGTRGSGKHGDLPKLGFDVCGMRVSTRYPCSTEEPFFRLGIKGSVLSPSLCDYSRLQK